ncbi:hypothetical protein EMN47_15060 [Prolixibacteraceae bacterium JC049]|nr:hypothetical protein [Prolixibacteraceae bacterium JC049]
MVKQFLIITLSLLMGVGVLFSFALERSEVKQISGVVLTIDDGYIDHWHKYLDYFDKHNVKLTMYITTYHMLKDSSKLKLKEFQKRGHEVGFHTRNHIHLRQFLKENSVENYLKQEIDPGLEELKRDGFNIENFAYPYGENSNEVDIELVKRFNSIRKLKWTSEDRKLKDADVFYSLPVETKILYGAGIDLAYKVGDEELTEALEKAATEKKILFLYCHRLDESGEPWTTSFNRIKQIVEFCEKNKVKMLTVRKFLTLGK